MPATITALCCLQAFLLDGRTNKSLFLTAQSAATFLDPTVRRSKLSRTVIAVQAILFAASLLCAAAASRLDASQGGAAMNALIKSLSPLLAAWFKGTRSARHWLAALGSFAGIALATNFHNQMPSQTALAAYALLFAGTVCGVVLGLAQERYGNCPYETTLGAALICAASVLLEPMPVLSAELLIGVPLYGLLSLFVSRAVRDYSRQVGYNAFLLSLMLNERRAVTIALGAITAEAPLRLLAGAVLALASIQLVPV